MDTTSLKKFAPLARTRLEENVATKLDLVLKEGSSARREKPQAVQTLEEAIALHSKEHVVERVAYTWFNRFCALRYMDLNRFNRMRIVSPLDGQTQPEILAEAKSGFIDEALVSPSKRKEIYALLDGRTTSHDAQGEAYRLLLVGVCNALNRSMPFLFQYIDDYTELLMPDNLLAQGSILEQVRDVMSEDVCKDVEVLGWLYQFYISEKKDVVIKSKDKITSENIPAATQLFTPNWIVRYLVQNSLGRLWLLNRPHSKLADKMEYYIPPETPDTEFLKIDNAEDLKVCDPACGSGHMLTYAFDLLYEIYEEEGYDAREIPGKILRHNLYGMEIDERAGELAAFALMMKARAKNRRFFESEIQPNICVFEDVKLTEAEIEEYAQGFDGNIFASSLRETLAQFEEATHYGSLIQPVMQNVDDVLREVKAHNFSQPLFASPIHDRAQKILTMVEYLTPRYAVVVANPPYMGSKHMNPQLKAWLKKNYSDVSSDLFSAFIVRNTELTMKNGQLGFMTPFVWMFISSYEKLRTFLIEKKTITSLIQLEYSGFDGATVPICTFTLENAHKPTLRGGYVRLSDFRGADQQGPRALEIIQAARAVGK